MFLLVVVVFILGGIAAIPLFQKKEEQIDAQQFAAEKPDQNDVGGSETNKAITYQKTNGFGIDGFYIPNWTYWNNNISYTLFVDDLNITDTLDINVSQFVNYRKYTYFYRTQYKGYHNLTIIFDTDTDNITIDNNSVIFEYLEQNLSFNWSDLIQYAPDIWYNITDQKFTISIAKELNKNRNIELDPRFGDDTGYATNWKNSDDAQYTNYGSPAATGTVDWGQAYFRNRVAAEEVSLCLYYANNLTKVKHGSSTNLSVGNEGSYTWHNISWSEPYPTIRDTNSYCIAFGATASNCIIKVQSTGGDSGWDKQVHVGGINWITTLIEDTSYTYIMSAYVHYNELSAGRTWQQDFSGYITTGNNTEYQQDFSGYITTGNESVSYQQDFSGYITTGNNTDYQQDFSGYITTGNNTDFQEDFSGWITTGNDTISYQQDFTGYITTGNESVSYQQDFSGYITTGNNTDFQEDFSGWITTGNNTIFQQDFSGYITTGNDTISFQQDFTGWITTGNNTQFQQDLTGWITTGNNTDFQGDFSGYITTGNETDYQQDFSGYITTGNESVSYQQDFSGYITTGNNTDYQQDFSGYITTGNNTDFQQDFSGYITTGNNTDYQQDFSGWITTGNESVVGRTWQQDFTGWITTGNKTINFIQDFSGWIRTANESNKAPTIEQESPVNESTGNSIYPSLSVIVNDSNGNLSKVYWYTNATVGGQWTLLKVDIDIVNETVRLMNFSNASTINTKYFYRVSANDTIDNTTKTFHFTTGAAGGGNIIAINNFLAYAVISALFIVCFVGAVFYVRKNKEDEI